MRYPLACTLIPLVLIGCAATPSFNTPPSDTQNTPTAPSNTQPAAYIAGRPMAFEAVRAQLIEAAGGTVMANAVLDALLRRRLADRGMLGQLTEQRLADEEQNLVQTLALEAGSLGDDGRVDADTGTRLLDELKQRRNLGPTRYEGLLRRNAMLRLLVADDVEIAEPAVRRAYDRRYGPRRAIRLIVTQNAGEAGRAQRPAASGEDFTMLVAEYSVDASAVNGGLLPPFHLDDPTLPDALREAVGRLSAGGVSPVVSVPGGFAVAKVERIIEARPVPYERVREPMRRQVRLEAEGALMRRLGRRLLSEADVVVLDPSLSRAWQQHKRQIESPTP